MSLFNYAVTVPERSSSAGLLPDWDLSPLGDPSKSGPAQALAALTARARSFSQLRSKLDAPDEDQFRQMLLEMAELSRESNLISGLAGLWFAENTQNQAALSFLNQTRSTLADIDNDLLFLELWWKDLPDHMAASFLQAAPDFDYWLKSLRAFKPHTLSEAEEKIINLKDLTGAEALTTLYDSLTNRYKFSSRFLAEAGQNPPQEYLTREELMVHVRDHRADVRARAYKEFYRVFSQDAPILGQIYQNLARDWGTENIRLRKYQNPIAARHKYNDLNPATVEAMLEACRAKAGLFSRFFKLKARALGLTDFSRYDLYAPFQAENTQYSFEQALELVNQAFSRFSPAMAESALNVPHNKRLSAVIRPGKQDGAFCASLVPGDIPWVLLNYQGRTRDLFTLAHELGHAVHSQLAGHHNIFHFHATLPLAETASTFGELLLAEMLKTEISEPAARAEQLFSQLDDAYATIGRQAFFAMFEITAHQMAAEGATTEELAGAYYDNLKKQFGPDFTIPEEFKWEWISIPHIYHSPFYVYAYSFGQLLVYALWRAYQQEGREAMAPRILNILSAGGSAPPEDILRQNGFDVSCPTFWLQGFETVQEMLTELETVLEHD